MREAARELDILFVVDEVITGFGRTGPMFACEAEGVDPDLMTLAKGLTAGYVPMGATMLSERIYATIADAAPAGTSPIGHGATYSAHPVSAAVALEVLRLYDEGGVLANGQRVATHFAAGLDELRAHPLVGDARYRGLLGALELVSDKATKRGFDASPRTAGPDLRGGLRQRRCVPLLRRRDPRIRACTDVHGGRVRGSCSSACGARSTRCSSAREVRAALV